MSGTGRRLGTAALTIAIALGAITVGAVQATAATKKKPVVLTIGVKQDIDSLNPYSGVSVAAYEAWTLEYDTLLNLSADGLKAVPELSTNVPKVASDGLTWTYHLRHDVKWSDGTPFTADDVVYTLSRMKKEEWSNFVTFVSGFKSITAPDKYTVVVKTEKPDPRMPYIPAYILQKKQWSQVSTKDVGTFSNSNMIGTGPFRLQTFKKGQYTKFKANPDYFGGAPHIDGITLQLYTNDETMVQDLQNGVIDAASDIKASLFPRVKADSKLTAVAADDGSFSMLTLNTESDGKAKVGNGNAALQDPRVRIAIAHAIDKQTLVDKVLNGYGVVGQSMNVALAPRWDLDPVKDPYKFDIKEANKILDNAGYLDTNHDGVREMPGGGKPINLRYDIRSGSSIEAPDAQYISGWLKQIGIKTTVKTVSEDQLTPIENAGTFDMATWGWTPFTDPDAQLSYLTCGQVPKAPDDGSYNDAFYCNKKYDELYTQQRSQLDETKRIAEVQEMQQIFYNDVPYVVMFRAQNLQAYNHDRFTGFTPVPKPDGPVMIANDFLNYTDVKQAGTGGGSSSSGVVIIIILVIVALGVIVGIVLAMNRRRTADLRE
ncbi:MAG TPA: ABC transporter substrate-binding protein [Acidimicrobiia bacterium]|jgi:peptide/nickel transport system substrate-binding protein|nr:ABC transporter substrate-binding protein [Acidimicrobiia bacterium]